MTSYTALLVYSSLALAGYTLAWIAYSRLLHPLKHIPGPFWASISRLWMVHHLWRGDMDIVQRKLHQRYGPLVRIAPDEIACAAPEAISKIYPTSKPLAKQHGFYSVWQNKSFSKYPDNFSNTDEKLHSERRRIVNNVYSMSTILSLEPYIDDCSRLFVQRMGEFADSGTAVDLGDWLQWYVRSSSAAPRMLKLISRHHRYAFDVVGELFFGQQFGFMENSHDHEGYIAACDALLPVLTGAGVSSPAVRAIILGSSLFSSATRKGLKAVDHIAAAARGCVATRSSGIKSGKSKSGRTDLLHHLLEIAKNKGEALDFGKGEVEYEANVAMYELCLCPTPVLVLR
jgi:hypothetical protein